MIAAGVLTPAQAYRAIDWNTIVLLLGMFVLSGCLRLAGFFEWAAEMVLTHVHTPIALLTALVFVSGLLSALLVNDTVCVMLAPLVIALIERSDLPVRPYLFALASGANNGSVTGVGPYLAIYLMATRHWDPAHIGLAMSAMGIASVVAQTPAGALTDRRRQKRWMIVAASVVVALGCLWIVMSPTRAGVVAAQALIGSTALIFPTAVAAITLGLVGPSQLAERMGRNGACNHAGTVGAAILAGLIGYAIAQEGIFSLVIAMSGGTLLAVLLIREEDIDHDLARGAWTQDGAAHIAGLGQLVADRRLAIFALAAGLFHVANAAMLPLVGELLSTGHDQGSSLYMSACMIVAQLVMIPVATWAGRVAGARGRKPVLLLGFLVLPVRGVLYTLSGDPYVLVSVQILDGMGAGIFGVLSVLVVADLTRGTGRFNLTNGAISTAIGIGAALSHALSGVLVHYAGFHGAFLTLAVIAGLAALWFGLMMPETQENSTPV
jgi:MFS family permease